MSPRPGTLVLVFLVLLGVNLVVSLVLAALPQDVQSSIGGLISGTLVAPFLALVVTMTYFRLRAGGSTVGGPATR